MAIVDAARSLSITSEVLSLIAESMSLRGLGVR
jgi:hypothetical protein